MVARLLSSQLGARGPLAIDSCRLLRTKYRFGDSLRVLHRIRVGGSDFDVAARTFTEGRSQRAYERALAAAVACEPLRPVIHSAEIGTVFWTFPNDRKLLGLQALKTIPHELAQLFVPAWRYSRVVAYAPEKCATAQCMDEDSNVLAYAKVYQGDEGERIYANYKALRRSLSPDTSAFCLPRAIAYSETHRMLLLETVEGERLVDVLGPRGPGRGYKHLGAALAALHSLPVPSGLRSFKRLDVGRIGRAAQIIAQARPDVWGEAFYLADELALRWEPPAGPPVCLHGDVHPKNVILRNDRLTLIDLDQSAAGSPAADLGSLLASLAYSRLSGLLSEARARELGDAFLNGYAARRALPSAACLGWHTSAALLAERALRAVNRIRPQGLAHLRRLLVEATRILRSGGKR
jgi:aminoglycoside phosphotransferase